MKAIKGNKVYQIDASQQKAYQDRGFDILEDGKVIAYGRGKTVPYGDYEAVKKECETLKAENEALKAEAAELEKKTGKK